jgi:hypothetical protein
MESAGWMEIIASIAPNLGIGIIFLYLYVQERKASREANERRQVLAQENSEKMLAAFVENTRVLQRLQACLGRQQQGIGETMHSG